MCFYPNSDFFLLYFYRVARLEERITGGAVQDRISCTELAAHLVPMIEQLKELEGTERRTLNSIRDALTKALPLLRNMMVLMAATIPEAGPDGRRGIYLLDRLSLLSKK
jgi:hypothetical protein